MSDKREKLSDTAVYNYWYNMQLSPSKYATFKVTTLGQDKSLVPIVIDEHDRTCDLVDYEDFATYMVNASAISLDDKGIPVNSDMFTKPDLCMTGNSVDKCIVHVLRRFKGLDEYKIPKHKIDTPKNISFLNEAGYCFERLDFDPTHMPTPEWDKIMARMNNSRAFQSFVGSCVSDKPMNRAQYVYLYGEGNTGKSILCDFLCSMMGRGAISATHRNLGNDFFLPSLVGKKLCYVNEAPGTLTLSDDFKALTGDADITVAKKNQDFFKARLELRFIFSSNNPLKMDNTIANRRRALPCLLLPYDSGSKLTQKEIEQCLKAEAPGIMQKCLDMLDECTLGDIIQTQENEEMLDALCNEQNDIFDGIFNDYFVRSPYKKVSKKDFVFVTQRLEGLKQIQYRNFCTYITKKYEADMNARVRVKGDGSRPQAIGGIDWNHKSEKCKQYRQYGKYTVEDTKDWIMPSPLTLVENEEELYPF